MATFARNVQDMITYVPPADADTKHEILIREYTRLGEIQQDISKVSIDNYTKYMLKRLELQQKLIVARQKFESDIAAVRGANDREAIRATQADLENIRTLSTQLAQSQNPAIATIMQGATVAARQSGAKQGSAAAAAAAWRNFAGALDANALATPANMYLPDLVRQMEDQFDPRLVDPNSAEGKEIKRLKGLAEGALLQQVTTRGELDDQRNKIAGIASGLLGAENLTGMIEEAKSTVNDFYAGLDSWGDLDPRGMALSENTLLAANEQYQDVRQQQEKVGKMLEPTDTRAIIAGIIGAPAFREWAEGNGYKLGTVVVDPETGKVSYAAGRYDDNAIRGFLYQQKHPDGGLQIAHNTGEWVAVKVRGVGRDVKLSGSQYEPMLASALGAGAGAGDASSSGTYAYTTDENGDRTYLTGEQVDALLDAQRTATPAPSPVYAVEVDDGNGGKTPYLYMEADGNTDPGGSGIVYTLTQTPGELPRWQPSALRLKDIGFDAQSIKQQGTQAVKTSPEGGLGILSPADIEGALASTIVPGTPEEVAQMRGMALKEMAKAAGVEITAQPPDVPSYTVYGKRLAPMAQDPQGSVRVRTSSGVEVIPASEVLSQEVTSRNSTTTMRQAAQRQLGRRDEARAGRAEPRAGGEVKPNLADKVGAAGFDEPVDLGENTPLRQPKTRIAGEEPPVDPDADSVPALEDPMHPQAILSDNPDENKAQVADPSTPRGLTADEAVLALMQGKTGLSTIPDEDEVRELGALLAKLRAPVTAPASPTQSDLSGLAGTRVDDVARPGQVAIPGQLQGEGTAAAAARLAGAERRAELAPKHGVETVEQLNMGDRISESKHGSPPPAAAPPAPVSEPAPATEPAPRQIIMDELPYQPAPTPAEAPVPAQAQAAPAPAPATPASATPAAIPQVTLPAYANWAAQLAGRRALRSTGGLPPETAALLKQMSTYATPKPPTT